MDTFFVKGPNDLNTREGRRKIIKKEFRFSNLTISLLMAPSSKTKGQDTRTASDWSKR
jgi:hypothetical protein